MSGTRVPTPQTTIAFPIPVDAGQFIWQSLQVCTNPAGEAFGTDQFVRKTKGLPKTSLIRWETEPCRYLNGVSIRTEYVTPPRPRNVKKVRVWLIAHLDVVKAKLGRKVARAVTGEHEYLPAERLCLELKKSLIFVDYWKRRPSKLRPGEKALRRKTVVNTGKSGPAQIDAYCVSDAKAIVAGKESDHLGTGRGETPAAFRESLRTKAKQVLRAILENDGPCTLRTAWTAARKHGVSGQAFAYARRALRCKARRIDCDLYVALPSQRFPESPAVAFLKGELGGLPSPYMEIKRRASVAGIGATAFRVAMRKLGLERRQTGGPWYLCRAKQKAPKLALEHLNGRQVVVADLRPYLRGKKAYLTPRAAFKKLEAVRSAFATPILLAHYLERHREHKSRVLGRTVKFHRVPRKSTLGKGWVYEEADILRLAEHRLAGSTAPLQISAASHTTEASRDAMREPLDAKGHPVHMTNVGELAAAIRASVNEPQRLQFDTRRFAVTLDGDTFAEIDPVAFKLLHALWKWTAETGSPVNGDALQALAGVKGKKIDREFDKLPAPLKNLILGQQAAGRWIQLPPMKVVPNCP